MSPRFLRVAHLKSRYGRVGGIESMLGHLVPALESGAVKQSFLLISERPDPELAARLSGGAVSVETLRWRGLAGSPGAAARLRHWLEARHIDVLHTHDMRANLLAALAAPRRRTPWLCHIHGWLGPTHGLRHRLYEGVDRRLLQFADHVVVGSYAALHEVRGEGANRASVAWNAIAPPAQLDPAGQAALRVRLGLPRDDLLVTTLGRLHRGKGQDVLLDAAAHLGGAGWRIVLVGEGESEPALRAQADRLGLRDRVFFTGFVERAVDYIDASDVIAVPSRKESLPLTCLEGMAFAKPVVVSTAGDMPRVVEDGVAGIVVPAGDAMALRDALVRLRDDPGLRIRLGVEGRRRVCARHSIDALARQITELYHVLARPGRT